MGTNGLAGRLARVEATTRPGIPDAEAELDEFLDQLSDAELRALLDAARRAERGESVDEVDLEALLGPERRAVFLALAGRAGRA